MLLSRVSLAVLLLLTFLLFDVAAIFFGIWTAAGVAFHCCWHSCFCFLSCCCRHPCCGISSDADIPVVAGIVQVPAVSAAAAVAYAAVDICSHACAASLLLLALSLL